MASSSYSASSSVRKNLLDREVTPMGEASSFERTTSVQGNHESSEGTPSPAAHHSQTAAISVASVMPALSRKRKNPNPLTTNPGPSRAFKKVRRVLHYPPIANPEYSWVHNSVDRHASEHDTRNKVDQFVFVYPSCEDSIVEHALARPYKAHERVYMKPRLDSHDFVYVYDYLFKEYNITFSLTDFEADMLNLMNIAPSQLHPNKWAFLRCFELLCDQLGFAPSVNVFIYFYQMKFEKLVGWVSLSSSHGSPLFTLYNSSYKHFKTKFFKLRCHPEDVERRLLFHPDHTSRHPLYWQKPTRFPLRPDYQLTPEEKEVIDAVRQLPRPLRTQALLCIPIVDDPDSLFLGITFSALFIAIAYVIHFYSCFVEIMGNNVDMKKLRAKLGGRRDFMADLKAAKRQRSDASDSPSAAFAQNDSSAPSDPAAGMSPSPAETLQPSGVPNLSSAGATGTALSEPAPEVINLEDSPEGGVGSPNLCTKPPPTTNTQPSMTDVATSSRPQASG